MIDQKRGDGVIETLDGFPVVLCSFRCLFPNMVFGFFIKNVPVVVCFFRSVPNDDAIPYIIHQNAFSWMTRPGFASKQKILFTCGAKRIFWGIKLLSVHFYFRPH